MTSEQPADQRHKKLKKPEVKRQTEDLSWGTATRSNAQAHGKCITSEGYCNQYDFK